MLREYGKVIKDHEQKCIVETVGSETSVNVRLEII